MSADAKSYRLVDAGSDEAIEETAWNTDDLLNDSSEDAILSSQGAPREWTMQK